MEVWQFILLIICWILIEYLCIHLEVKFNKELFYDLHEAQIIRELEKMRKGEKKVYDKE